MTFVYGDGLTILAHNRLLSMQSSFLGDILDIIVKKERGRGRWQTISHGRLICVDRENKYKSAMFSKLNATPLLVRTNILGEHHLKGLPLPLGAWLGLHSLWKTHATYISALPDLQLPSSWQKWTRKPAFPFSDTPWSRSQILTDLTENLRPSLGLLGSPLLLSLF